MKLHKPTQYFDKYVVEESPVCRFNYDLALQQVAIVICYAAETISAAFEFQLIQGKDLRDFPRQPDNFNRVTFTPFLDPGGMRENLLSCIL